MEGSSEVNQYIESSVGTLVWVRRRNGSWWPGRILGPEELPGSHLLSPRTGTPVKLLGREDGSVDWYNIEKSRRVKAFRCGDFDECIERAKSLASVLTKKREKYARREDAILHALELEKKYAEQNIPQDSNLAILDDNYKVMGLSADDLVLNGDMERIPCQSDFPNDFMDSESSADVAQARLDKLFSLPSDRKFLEQEWEDDIVETIPQMKGLQDFGLKITSSKHKKECWTAPYDEAQNTALLEDENKMLSCATKNVTLCPAANGFKVASTAVSKRKRPLHLSVSEDENGHKRRDFRKNLNRLLDGGAKLAGPDLKLPSHIVAAGRNDYAIMQPKQESLPQAFDLKPILSGTSVGLWQGSQIEAMSRHEKIDYSTAMDKSCSSFADHMKLSYCNGQPYHYGGSQQVDVSTLTGSTFLDTLLHGGTGLRSSFFQGSAYGSFGAASNNNSLEQMSSLSMVESLSSPLSNFPMWANYTHTETLSENEFGLNGRITNNRAICLTNYAFENVVSNSIPHIFNVYDNNIEDHSMFAKRNMYDPESSLVFSRNNSSLDPVKATAKASDMATGEAEDKDRCISKEDEADSPEQIPVSPDHYDSFGANEQQIGDTFKEYKGEADVHNFQDMADPLNDNNKIASFRVSISKWQRKGKRWTYARSGSTWRMASIKTVLDDLAFKNGEVQESQTSVDDFTVNNPFWGSYRAHIDSPHEDEQESEEAELELIPVASMFNDGYDGFAAENGNVSRIRKSFWIDVPIRLHGTTHPQSDDVPVVSLISKLNGKVIVGHPVQVEIIHKNLEDGHVGACSSSIISKRKKLLLQPVWRTARRRTAMQRVPRSCGIFIPHGYAPEVLVKQPQQSLGRHKSKIKRKKSSLSSCLSASKRKLPKHMTPFPQKTRMLSSIAKEQFERSSDHMVLRPSCPLVVTCIPVNVIFNRIREVLYREANQAPYDTDNIT